MSNISNYQSVFRVAKTDGSNGYGPRSIRRNRALVSCVTCRARKLKCDRQQPCGSCVKRSDAEGCSYGSAQSARPIQPGRALKTSEAQARLQKLEEMVASFVNKAPDQDVSATLMRGVALAGVCDPSVPIEPDVPESERKVSVDTKYSGPTHWTKVLSDIRDIQGVLEDDDENEPEQDQPLVYPDGPSVMIEELGHRITTVDLSNSLPAKEIVDELIADYVSKTHSAIMHTKKFMREYETFWADPSSASFLWLSLLFSTCYIGACAHLSAATPGTTLDGPPPAVYLKRAGQALQAGKFHKGGTCAVEATLMYAVAKYIQTKDDPDTDAWLIMGLATRVAMREGYHRDPQYLGRRISPFEGEMRRRVFHTMATFDLLLSYQAGLPGTLMDEQIDCALPSNLLDSDFDEDSTQLPPSRPPTDDTPMLYFVTKFGLTSILRRVMQHALQTARPAYAATLQLDAELRAYHESVPPGLKMRPLHATRDPIYVVMNRLNLEIMYLKNIAVLHRPHLSGAARADPSTDYSRIECVNAAMAILGHQADLNALCAPGQPFEEHRWVLTSLTMHDFLMASMLICLDLVEQNRDGGGAKPAGGDYASKHDALRTALDIWTSRRSFSREARRASDVLGIMLSKMQAPIPQSTSATSVEEISNNVDSLFGYSNVPGEENEIDWDSFNRCLQGSTNDLETFPFGLEWQALDGIVAQNVMDELVGNGNSNGIGSQEGTSYGQQNGTTMTGAMMGDAASPVHRQSRGGMAF